ncbi:MAG: acylphosphatase [Candidatus Chisholmbacteria bacterium RIFCSPHIGHO2_12_FULL_49_9]|uniref:Acylphosphatase n=1 Tax=Candidatus Chisholmbacteria bacterium RIFCSPHIGHO2_01_FULL_52_32 TaxID=1797591 RepID=A0A1G1VQT2_9BACT|nr:MAG: acylphosphatase [Candidatus Chisholmbacteria bacterium RIFCSPHIGHO2_01_FULL_52_32]OGY20724.1 MAG: acylphosphatase [Candidatus Chisholmbacteria bacterium RIFCSPLOWO2_01_FULL_50_28]OGY20915.1 MAG: acylphosphatase [Candidatus Chisholmbacteria bacterium RIFCSPHIGHO2_12_FULL_49_9]
MRVRAQVVISGLVQGVFFRAYTQKEAQALGLSGWVRNLPDGRVEAAFEGEKTAVNEMIAWCWEGSPSAKVSKVDVSWEKPEALRGFEVRR